MSEYNDEKMERDYCIGDFYPRKLQCLICNENVWDFESTLIPYGEYDQEAICAPCLIKMVSKYKGGK